MPLHVSSTVLIIRRSKLCYTASGIITLCRWPSGAQVERVLTQPAHRTATCRCNDTRYCIIQFDLLMMSKWCSKHVEAYNKLNKTRFCALSWLITKIIMRCTVSKTFKKIQDTLFVLVTIKENEMGEVCSTHVAVERDKNESRNLKGEMLLRSQA